jgi:DNA gyrase/topoisomerase IV subunit B
MARTVQCVKLQQEDVCGRMAFVLSARLLDPQFQGQVKEKLNSREAVKLVSGVVRDPFEIWLNHHVDAGKAIAELAKAGFDPVFGARPLKRAIQHQLENPVAKLILEGKFGPKDVIPVGFEDGSFVFDRVVH